MAKVFAYTRLHCFNPVPPAGDGLERPCGRVDFTDVIDFSSNGTTSAVAESVDVSATTGANIWFKSTYMP